LAVDAEHRIGQRVEAGRVEESESCGDMSAATSVRSPAPKLAARTREMPRPIPARAQQRKSPAA
jgi:hypothetical protein